MRTARKSRDTLIAETTDRLLGDWNAEIQAGSKRAVSDLQNTVLDRLTEDDAKALFVQAAAGQGDAAFTQLVGKVMRDVCAADAKRTVDLLLADLVASHAESRIDRAVEAQAA